jgi:hypothetical protein
MDSVHGPWTTAHGLVHDGLKRWHGQGSPDRGGYGSSELIGDSRGGREEDGGFILTLTGPRAAARRWCGGEERRWEREEVRGNLA